MDLEDSREETGSKYDMRNAELGGMGEKYIKMHNHYWRALETVSNPSKTQPFKWLNRWLNSMRVLNSYFSSYSDKPELEQETREKIKEVDKRLMNMNTSGNVPTSQSSVVLDMEEIKNSLEELRKDAGFSMPMQTKRDESTTGAEQLRS
jgi:hypothetical protein